jgi:creatinine amidohydrolase
MTLDQVRQLDPQVVVVGVGSTEPHGNHLPYGTDSIVVESFCGRAVTAANAAGGRVLMYPTLRLSNNVNFKAFPFAGRIRVRTLMNVLLDIIEALEEDGIRKIVLANGHGGNEVLPGVLREHAERHGPRQGAFVGLVHIHGLVPPEVRKMIEKPSDHAGEAETCSIMYLRPDLVRPDQLADCPTQRPEQEWLAGGKMHYVRRWHCYAPTSAVGDSRLSTAQKGKAFIDSGVQVFSRMLADLSQAPWHPDFPFPKRD